MRHSSRAASSAPATTASDARASRTGTKTTPMVFDPSAPPAASAPSASVDPRAFAQGVIRRKK